MLCIYYYVYIYMLNFIFKWNTSFKKGAKGHCICSCDKNTTNSHHICKHTHLHTCTYKHTHTYMHACMHAYTQTSMHACMHGYVHVFCIPCMAYIIDIYIYIYIYIIFIACSYPTSSKSNEYIGWLNQSQPVLAKVPYPSGESHENDAGDDHNPAKHSLTA